MQKKIPNLLKVLRADNVEKLKIILENNVNLQIYTSELPAIFDFSPTISAFIAYFGATDCFNYIVQLINQIKTQEALEEKKGINIDNEEKNRRKKFSITYADERSRSTIHFAAAGGKSKFIRRLVEDFNQLSDIDEFSRNALHYAAEYNQKKAVDLIVSFGKLSVDAKDLFGNTALHLATDNMCTMVVKSLVEDHKCNINLKDKFGASPLMFAAKVGSIDLFNFFLEKNANYKVKSKTGLTLLHYSAFGNDTDIIDKLVNEMGFTTIDVEDQFKRTPLFYACEKGAYYSAQSFIVDYGASVDVQDVDDATPIHAAAKSGNPRLFTLLLDHCSSIDDFTAVDVFGHTVLHYAAEVGSIETIRFMLDYETSSYKGKVDTNDTYLFRNKLIERTSNSGYSALHSAADRNQPQIIDLLVNDYGFDINQTDIENETPLMCAAKTNSIESVVTLIKLGADLSVKDNDSKTALDISYQHGYTQLSKILESNGAPSERFASEMAEGVPSPSLNSSYIEPLSNREKLEPI